MSPQDGDSNLPFYDDDANSAFDAATALPLSNVNELEFEGRIELSADLDLFDLGLLSPGDRLYIDVQPDSEELDLVAAVFDSRQYVHAFNDDREPSGENLNPLLDFVVRGEAGRYYLGITPYTKTTFTGDYRVDVRITRGQEVPPGVAQIVFLDWDGGQNILVENVGLYDLSPFDAGDMGSYGGQTEEMKDRVEEIVAARYAGYNLILLNSDDDPVPTQRHSTVYFGGRHPQAFAISQQIDTYNVDPEDDAIIFTESYRNAFVITPTFEQMATALGNTVAHEVGHLLGLVHTEDCDSLMDATCPNERLLLPQQFVTAPLDTTVFPVGYQAAEELLEWVLGFVGL